MSFENNFIDADQKQKEELEKAVAEMEQPKECADIIEAEDNIAEGKIQEGLNPIINGDEYEKTPFTKSPFRSEEGDIAA
jgi:hypothetical protein